MRGAWLPRKCEVVVDGNSSGIVASVLETTKAIEENLKNVPSFSVHVVIQIRKYPTHFLFLKFSIAEINQNFEEKKKLCFGFLIRSQFSGEGRKRSKEKDNFDFDFGFGL